MHLEKEKDKTMSDKLFNEIFDAYNNKGSSIKKRKIHIKWQSLTKLLLIIDGKKLCQEVMI